MLKLLRRRHGHRHRFVRQRRHEPIHLRKSYHVLLLRVGRPAVCPRPRPSRPRGRHYRSGRPLVRMTKLDRPFPTLGPARIRVPRRRRGSGTVWWSLSVPARKRAFDVRRRCRGDAPFHHRRRRHRWRKIGRARRRSHVPPLLRPPPGSVLSVTRRRRRARPDDLEPVLRDMRLELLRGVSHGTSRCSMWSVRVCECSFPLPSFSRLTPERERGGGEAVEER